MSAPQVSAALASRSGILCIYMLICMNLSHACSEASVCLISNCAIVCLVGCWVLLRNVLNIYMYTISQDSKRY